MYYAKNKLLAISRDSTPTLTDQSAARTTDINIIVGQQLTTGYAPGSKKPPIYGDFTNFPTDLREALEASRAAHQIRRALPDQLKDMPLEQLLTLQHTDIERILKPADPILDPQKTGEPPQP